MDMIDYAFLFFMYVSLLFSFLFLMLFSENRKNMQQIPKNKSFPSVSIIVPAHNEEKTIGHVISNIKKLEYPRKIEIIVIDDGSTDNTAKIAKNAGVKVISQPNLGKANALNTGLKIAKGDIFACIDADSYPERNALISSVPFFTDNVAAVTTKILAGKGSGIMTKFQEIEFALIAWSRKLFEYIESIYATPGPLCFYKKDVLKKLGGFDGKNATEDIEIAWRLLKNGYKIRMSPAKVYTIVPSTLKKWWKQRVRWNIGGIQTTLKYKNSLFKKTGGSRMFGFFVVPFFMLSYIMAILSLSILFYIVALRSVNFILFYIQAVAIGINPFEHFSFNFLVNIFTILGILLFVLSFALLKYGLSDAKKSTRELLMVLIYISIYLMLFPLVLVDSTIKYLQGYKEW